MLLDEFAILGRVNQIKSAISYARGYNIRFLLVYQSEAQLEDKSLYDKEGARTIIDNLNVRVVYPTKLADSQAKLISETLGSKTVRVRNKSINSGKHASRSTAFQEQKRMLMMPHELIELGFEKYPDTTIGKNILILRDNQRPFKLVKLLSFADVSFSKAIEQSKEDFNKLKESGKLLI